MKQETLLVHELAHLRRRDHWVRMLEMVVMAFYWWCPVAWLVRRALRDAEEECCDAWVVSMLPTAARAYADALLDTVDFLAGSAPVLPLGASGLWHVRRLKSRLALIIRGGVPRRLSRAGTAGVVSLSILMVPLRPPAFTARTYQIMDLGSLGGPTSYPQRINNHGQVVGLSMDPSGQYHAFRTATNRPINPARDRIGGHFAGPSWVRGRSSDGRGQRSELSLAGPGASMGINDAGKVVGESLEGVVVARVLAEGPARGVMSAFDTQALGALGPTPDGGPAVAYPADINERGEVVGRSSQGGVWDHHAFRTQPDGPINPATDDLGTLAGGSSEARGINALGQVTGDSEAPGGPLHAFRTAPDRPINAATDDLGSLTGMTGGYSRGFAINDNGQVAGWSVNGQGGRHAFRTRPNMPINPATDDLGTLGGADSYAYAINNNGLVVGRSARAPSLLDPRTRMVGNVSIPPVWCAFLHDGRQMLDLNHFISPGSGWVLYEAKDINDHGMIIGNGISPEGKLHGFLLTPVPEPGQVVLLGLGTLLCALAFTVRHSGGGV